MDHYDLSNEDLYTDIKTTNNLFQNFYIIGLDNKFILSREFYYNLKERESQIDLTPKIISKFPEINNHYINIPENIIIRQCFPNGINIIQQTEKESKIPENEIFFFTLDNFPVNYQYKKVYFTCLLFYENLDDYYSLFYKINNIKDKRKESTEIQYDNKNMNNIPSTLTGSSESLLPNINCSFYVAKVICFSSLLLYPNEVSKLLKYIYSVFQSNQQIDNMNLNRSNSINNTLLTHNKNLYYPMEKIIENIIFNIPIPPKGEYKVIYKFPTLSNPNENINSSPKNTKVNNSSIDKNNFIIFYQNAVNELPTYSSIDLNMLFNLFKIEEILNIYKCILLEIPLLFFSKSKQKLSQIIEGFISLIYPFEYVYQYITILPYLNYSLIESEVSYIYGINEEYKECFFTENLIEIENKLIIVVDLDSKKIIEIKDKDKISNINIDFLNDEKKLNYILQMYDNINLPKHYKKKLLDTLTKYLNKIQKSYISNKNNKYTVKDFNIEIRNEFFNFLVSIFADYAKYLIIDSKNIENLYKYYYNKSSQIDINRYFAVAKYLSKVEDDDILFYERFLGTKIFKYFIIYKKLFPITNATKFEILFFDEKIGEKKNRSVFNKNLCTPFLSQKLNVISNKIIAPPPLNFTSDEINYIADEYNYIKTLKYYQTLNFTNLTQVGFNIKYYIFPKLLYDNYFFDKKKYSYIYKINNSNNNSSNYSNEIYNNINKKMIKTQNSLLNNKENLKIYEQTDFKLDLFQMFKINKINYNQDDYIYMSWLLTVSLTFYYNNSFKEKSFRIAEILDKLNIIEYKNDEILILILYAILSNTTDNNQIITIYEILSKFPLLYHNYTLFAFLSQKLNKKFNRHCLKLNKVARSMSSRALLMSLKDDEDDDSENEDADINESKEDNNNQNNNENNTNINVNKDVKINASNELMKSLKKRTSKNEIEFQKRSFMAFINNNNSYNNSKELFDFEMLFKCPECNELTELDFSFSNINYNDKNNNDINSNCFKCQSCEKFIKNINVNVGINENYYEIFEIITPHELYMRLRKQYICNNLFQIDVNNFYRNNKNLFWNCIFYFSMRNLSFDFLIIYENKNNININSINSSLSFNDLINKQSNGCSDNNNLVNINNNNINLLNSNNNKNEILNNEVSNNEIINIDNNMIYFYDDENLQITSENLEFGTSKVTIDKEKMEDVKMAINLVNLNSLQFQNEGNDDKDENNNVHMNNYENFDTNKSIENLIIKEMSNNNEELKNKNDNNNSKSSNQINGNNNNLINKNPSN